MRFQTVTSPHVLFDTRVGQVMRRVLYAMLPGIAALIWFFGWGVLINLVIATVMALAAETARWAPLASVIPPEKGRVWRALEGAL